MKRGFRPPPLRASADALLREAEARRRAGATHDDVQHLRTEAVRVDPVAALHDWGIVTEQRAAGEPGLKPRLDARVARWRFAAPGPMGRLTHKLHLHDWAVSEGIPVPARLGAADRIEDLRLPPAGERPPGGIVVKPVNLADAEGVVLLRGGIDRMTGVPVPDEAAYLRRLYANPRLADRPVLVEAAMLDAGDPAGAARRVPLDYKLYAVGGRTVFLNVLDRSDGAADAPVATFDRHWRRLPSALTTREDLPKDLPIPDGAEALIALGDRLSERLPWLLRHDLYDTPDGPVLGEVTTYPNAGIDMPPWVRRTLLQMWRIVPDPD